MINHQQKTDIPIPLLQVMDQIFTNEYHIFLHDGHKVFCVGRSDGSALLG